MSSVETKPTEDRVHGAAEEHETASGLESSARRRFLGGMAATPMALGLLSGTTLLGKSGAAEAAGSGSLLGKLLMPQTPEARRARALRLRVRTALQQFHKPLVNHPNNDDEKDLEPLGLAACRTYLER